MSRKPMIMQARQFRWANECETWLNNFRAFSPPPLCIDGDAYRRRQVRRRRR